MKPRGLWIVLALVAVGVVSLLSLRRGDPRVPRTYRYDVDEYLEAEKQVPLPYKETARWPVALREPRALAVKGDGPVVVVGDRVALVLDDAGEELRRIELADEPRCVAVADVVYVGFLDRIVVYGLDGEKQAEWESLGEQAYLTGLAILDGEVFASDYGQRVVWRFDAAGKMRGRIRSASKSDGFVFPSPTFDLAAGGDKLWVINSGRRRVEQYSPEGKRGTVWGRSSMELDGFSGCCNPTHIALMPDGRFVTTEKGLPRVKVYAADGTFAALVAGSEQLGQNAGLLDVAVDGGGRILLLDAADRSIRIYEEQPDDG
jgi:hypothetical protein